MFTDSHMRNRLKIKNFVALAFAMLFFSGCSSVEFTADSEKVKTIKSVAVVSFKVPAFVTEEADSGMLGGLTALVGAVTSLASDEEELGNGREVASDAVPGFIEQMSSKGRWNILPMDKVTGNADIQSMVDEYDDSVKDRTTGLEGTPAIPLELGGGKSEYAAKAAQALGVDGVMMVDFHTMEYSLYTGMSGNGQAKAKGNASFVLYDRNGSPVWESASPVVWSETSAAMVAGAINPLQSVNLHKSIGEALAADVLKIYLENAGG
ncbi:MAG: hypothetical protein OEY09_06955 [Gammaproteobacteria bacterium]|nr:hypothetical protein [Gammaproteobacteria bacterium]